MRRGSIIASVLFVSGALALGLACSSQSHGPHLDGCPTDGTCVINPGTGTGGTTTTTTTTTTPDAATPTDALIPTVDVNGTVNTLQAFGDDPATDAIVTQTGLSIRAVVNGSLIDTPVTAGSFAVAGVTQTPPITWVQLISNSTTTQTVYGFATDGTPGTLTLAIPLVPPELISAATVQFAADSDGGTINTTNSATVILQLLDAANAGAPIVGATALQSPAAVGPFYDDGSSGLKDSSTGTSGRGTIVFFGADIATFGALTFTAKGGPSAFRPILANNAVTFLRLALK